MEQTGEAAQRLVEQKWTSLPRTGGQRLGGMQERVQKVVLRRG